MPDNIINTFVDFSTLPNQATAYTYGAIDNENYRVSSVFNLTVDSMAFAITDGVICIQPQENPLIAGDYNTGKVNIILKPTTSIQNGLPNIKYIIYRGLKRDDFYTVAGTLYQLIANTATASDYIKQIWTDFTTALSNGVYANSNPLPNIPSPLRLGLDWIGGSNNDYNNLIKLDKIFSEELLDISSNLPIVLSQVKRGASLGRFSSGKIAIDIVLEDIAYSMDLKSARKQELILSAPVPSTTYNELPSSEKKTREYICAFLDPAVLYASYGLDNNLSIENRKIVNNSVQIDPAISTLTNIFNQIIVKYRTKNTIYIDLRNEFGHSINYHKDNQGISSHTNYGKHFRLKINSQTVSARDYYQSYWPIFKIVSPAVQNNLPIALQFSFWRSYNPVPVIYFDYALKLDMVVRHNYEKFFVDDYYDKLNTPYNSSVQVTNHWSDLTPIIYTPITNGTPVCAYVKIIVNRRHIPVNAPLTSIKRSHYLDNLFGPLYSIQDLIQVNTNSASQWSKLQSGQKHYVNLLDEFGVEAMTEISVAITPTLIMFMAQLMEVNRKGALTGIKSVTGGVSQTTNSIESVNETQLDIDNLYVMPLSTGQINYHILLDPPARSQNSNKNGIIRLVMTLAEYDSLRNVAAAELDQINQIACIKWLQEDDNLVMSDQGTAIYEFNLTASGWNSSNQYTEVATALQPPIKVMTVDSKNYATNGAAANATQNQYTGLILLNDLVSSIQVVENTYRISNLIFPVNDVDGVTSLTLNAADNLVNSITRIRAHYYGRKRDENEALAEYKNMPFDLIFKNDLHVFEQLTYHPTGENSKRLRGLYQNDLENKNPSTGEYVFRQLTTRPKNWSPYLNILNPISNQYETVDFGHLLYGFEGLLRQDPALLSEPIDVRNFMLSNQSTRFLKGNLSANTGIGMAYKRYNLYIPFDFGSFIADLGTAAAKYYYPTYIAFSAFNPPSNPELNKLEELVGKEASPPDLKSDVDSIGLYYVYLDLGGNANVKLSDIINQYYSTSGPNSVKNRWFNFCRHFGFIKVIVGTSNYEWIPTVSSQQVVPNPTWAVERDYWRLRMFYFMQLFSSILFDKYAAGASLETNWYKPRLFRKMWQHWESEDISNGFSDLNYPNPIEDSQNTANLFYRKSARQICSIVFEDIFLESIVKPALQAEKAVTGVNISGL